MRGRVLCHHMRNGNVIWIHTFVFALYVYSATLSPRFTTVFQTQNSMKVERVCVVLMVLVVLPAVHCEHTTPPACGTNEYKSGDLCTACPAKSARALIGLVCTGDCGNCPDLAASGVITDGSGNANYANDLACSWSIGASDHARVTFTIISQNTETNYDFVSIQMCKPDGVSACDDPVSLYFKAGEGAEFNADFPMSFSSTSEYPVLKLIFVSDYSSSAAGFEVDFTIDGFTTVDECACEPGFTGVFTSCTQCATGKYKASYGSESCATCETGSIPNAQKTDCDTCELSKTTSTDPGRLDACVNCHAGKYGTQGGLCQDCPADTYSLLVAATSAEVCTACPAAPYSRSQAGSDDEGDCYCLYGLFGEPKTGCYCSVGYELIASQNTYICSSCAVNTYNDVSFPAATRCTACPDNSYNTDIRQDRCLCNAGYTGGGTDTLPCIACEDGTYKKIDGPMECLTCVVNSVSSADRTQCDCNAGYEYEAMNVADGHFYSDLDYFCSACAVGSYKSIVGTGGCEACWIAPTTWPDWTEVTDSTQAGSTTFRERGCIMTTESTASTSVTNCLCPGGCGKTAIRDVELQNANGEMCIECGSESYSTWANNLENLQCISCYYWPDVHGYNAYATSIAEWGSDQCTCNAGYFFSGDDCTDCPSGKYKDTEGTGACTSCPVGSTSTGTAETDVSACVCDVGYKLVTGGASCGSCAAGKYGSSAGVCTDCEAGKYSSQNASAVFRSAVFRLATDPPLNVPAVSRRSRVCSTGTVTQTMCYSEKKK